MKELMLFQNDNLNVKIRSVIVGSEIYFLASDVSSALGYTNTRKSINDHCTDVKLLEDILNSNETVLFDGKPLSDITPNWKSIKLIQESDVYRLIMRSNLPNAIVFQDWVVKEVLPSLRKTLTALETVIFKGNIDGLVWSKDGIPITTSRIISKIVNKHHKNILRDIRKEINKLQSSNMSHEYKLIIDSFKEIKYISENGQEYKEYEIGELGAMQLLLKYSTEYRARFVIAFNNLKNAMISMFKVRLIESVIPQDNRKRQYIYIIYNPLTNNIKIGVAHDVDNRIKQLETGAGVKLDLIYKSIICSNAFNIEKDVHSKFENNRVFGEWFNISPNEVISFLEQQTFVLKSEFMKELSIFKPITKD